MAAKQKPWTREQVLIALNLYCQLPFGKLDARTPSIITIAGLLGRTPGALAMKLNNLASLDPAITANGRVGLTGSSSMDKEIWDAFMSDPELTGLESQELMDALVKDTSLAALSSESELDISPVATEEQTTGLSRVKVRRGQAFFRRAVLASYQGRCCMSGLQTSRLLVASHIKPWYVDVSNRLNPRNGLCLSALHDRAYDLGFISVRPDFRIVVSSELSADEGDFSKDALLSMANKAVELPNKFHPSLAFLEWHYTTVFRP